MPDPHCRIGRVKRRGNIYAFRDITLPERPREEQPVQPVIQVLEELLVEAKAGKLRAFAAALVYPGNFTTHTWARGYGQTAHSQAASIYDLSFAYARDRDIARRERDQQGET
jgi:hypothetical protein